MPWKDWAKRGQLLVIFAAILMAFTLAACAKATPAPTKGDFCRNYRPVYTSPKDTEKTRAQTDVNNGVFECLCKNNCPKN